MASGLAEEVAVPDVLVSFFEVKQPTSVLNPLLVGSVLGGGGLDPHARLAPSVFFTEPIFPRNTGRPRLDVLKVHPLPLERTNSSRSLA